MYLFCWLLLLAATEGRSDLPVEISRFWDALQAGDRQTAASIVSADSVKAFRNRREMPFREWHLTGIRMISPFQAEVTLEVELFLPGHGLLQSSVRQEWRKLEGHWKLGCEPPRGHPAYTSPGTPRPVAGGISATPPVLLLHFLNAVQRGNFQIGNGLTRSAGLEHCEFDRSVFQIRPAFETLAPSETGNLFVEYVGRQTDKNQRGSIHCSFLSGSKVEELELTVLYNHVTPEAMAFLGLSAADLKRLKPGEILLPRKDLLRLMKTFSHFWDHSDAERSRDSTSPSVSPR